MKIDILTLFPGMFEGFLKQSILQRAEKKGLAEISIYNIREFSTDKHQQADDYAFGGGAGMVLMAQPIADCLDAIQKDSPADEVIFLTPDGELFTQAIANELSLKKHIILISGRYKGIDQRIRDHFVTREISIGEYVLTGGELPAAVMADAIIRLLPGVLGDESSALTDSFQGDLLDAPVYTRPVDFRGHIVPEVLLSGDHKKIEAWRHQQSIDKEEERFKKINKTEI